jgi:predicted permease
MSNWLRRVWYLVNRRRYERDLLDEMRDHRAAMHDPAKFGDTHRWIEQSRDAWGWNWLDDAMQDLKLGVRGLLRAPTFAITGVLILTFGIGLNLTLFQMVNVTLLQPPPIPHPETLARFTRNAPGDRSGTVAYQITQAVARENTVLSTVLVVAQTAMTWGDEMQGVSGMFVSPDWFTELGATMAAGRGFSPSIDHPASPTVAVVNHQFWRTTLGSNPSIVGSTVKINKIPVTVIGITAREFRGLALDQPAIWLVMEQREHFYPDSTFLRAWDSDNTNMYGRLKEGVSPAAARDSLRALMRHLHEQRPNDIRPDEWLEPATGSMNFMTPGERAVFFARISLVGSLTVLVLMVAAANIGNLVLSRATGRSRELGVRVALGAKRSRIVRQLMIETLPLALLGAAAGVLLSSWAAATIGATGEMADNISFAPDWQTMMVSLAMTVIALAVIGAVPAAKVARQDLIAAIKDGGQQVSISLDKARLRRFLMGAQVLGSCLVLVLSAMMIRQLQRLLLDDLGFEYAQAATMQAGLARYGFKGPDAIEYWRAVEARVQQHAETAAVTLAMAPPLGGRIQENTFRDDAPGLEVVTNRISPSFFDVMKISLLAGRTFTASDDPKTSVILSRLLVMEMYGTLDVLGRGFPPSKPAATIVGVVGDAHSIRLGAVRSSELYRPLLEEDYAQAVMIARARGDAALLAPVLREAAAIDSRVIPAVALLRDAFERRMIGARVVSTIALTTGLLTLLIACLGIFGVVSYGAAQRTKELGIHVALGATNRSIVRLVVRHIVWPVTIGTTIGVAAAAPIGKALVGGPIQLNPYDPAAYAAALALFLLAAVAAALFPAMRVIKADPVQALRHS